MIIWLASYPKSGNTWVRSFIASLLYSENGIFNFKLLEQILQFPDKRYFVKFTQDIGNLNEIKKYWLSAQREINKDKKLRFFKTHHINCTIDKDHFTDKKNTLATIYIIRDPRNLINSISNHYSKSIEEAKDFILTPKIIAGSKKDGGMKKDDLKTLIGTWSEHYRFWKKNNNNYLLIKYEDLIENPYKELKRIISFLEKFIKVDTNKVKNKNIINSTNFERLKSLENEGKFKESAHDTYGKLKNFFYKGPKNKWQDFLDPSIKNEIETKLSIEMKELGYL